MIHQPLGGFQGQASDIDIHAREILAVRDRLNKILAQHTGQPLEKIQVDTDRDNFMSGEDAVDYGLIDKVLNRAGVMRRRPSEVDVQSGRRLRVSNDCKQGVRTMSDEKNGKDAGGKAALLLLLRKKPA